MLSVLEDFLHRKQIKKETQETRILIELGKLDPQQVVFILKKALSEGKMALQRAAFRELIELAKQGGIGP